jgi:cellulose synthase/poly-beta-1,6-N-acetylglucosamine synthase-like glycosyltransferase
MTDILYVSDFFLKDVVGGAELADSVIIEHLKKDYTVEIVNCKKASVKKISQFDGKLIILSNFNFLDKNVKKELLKKRYFIIEHDHKFIDSRDPSRFLNDIVPTRRIRNLQLYRKAEYVFCQSLRHAKCLRDNLLLDNVANFGMSFWSQNHLSLLRNNSNCKKEIKNAILSYHNPLKGANKSIGFCIKKKLSYELLPTNIKFESFIPMFASAERFIFFPELIESFSRIAVEARMLNVSLITNKNLGCLSESWFSVLRGVELIDFVEEKISHNLEVLSNCVENQNNVLLIEPYKYPTTSIITSMFKGDKYIERFLSNITSQTVFDNCELIIIDAASPGNEFQIIEKYMNKFSNIKYLRLEKDPGIYGAWNMAIEKSTGTYITNANLDDIRAPEQIEIMINYLEKNTHIDLVYGESYITNNSKDTFDNNSSEGRVYPVKEFSRQTMIKCLPGCMPVWRKKMHTKAGYFDENYKYAGDHEMWLRAVRNGSEFKKISGIYGLYYMNPDGLSISDKNSIERYKEEKKVFWEFVDVFGTNNTNLYRDYFSRIL